MSKPQDVSNVRTRTKTALVEAFGHRCQICGLVDDEVIYDFHHINPFEKEFQLSNGSTRSKESTVKEAKKCAMICSHCHRKIDHSMIEISDLICDFNEEIFYKTYNSLLKYPNCSH